VTWVGALIPLLIVLFYCWPYITRVATTVAPPTPEPPPESSAANDFRRRLAKVNFEDLIPPTDLHASEPWDEYWRRQHKSGLWMFNEMFVDDRELLRVIEARGFQRVLCVGSGLALEPHALAAAGLRVTMLDISRDVVAAMSATTFPSDAFSRILDSSQLRSGGHIECVAGDLIDPAVCPGPYDVVIERKTLQLFPEAEREAALAAVAARMDPNGILFSHTHDGRGGPGRPSHHSLDPFLERCGFTQRSLDASKSATGRTAITFLSTG
jgi:thiopurine S-methyltransferase